MTSLLQASWAAAVTLALYAFYSYWEAGRADLAANFRHLLAGQPDSRLSDVSGATYRSRARWAGVGSLLLALGSLVMAL